MKNAVLIACVVLIWGMIAIKSCNPPWEEHYSDKEPNINMKLWDAISKEPRYSTFVSEIEASGLDSIFQEEQVYTMFIPPNEAFESIVDTGNVIQLILSYHMSKTIFIDRNVQDWRRLLTISGKFALIEASGDGYTFDGIPMEFSSPLYLDGKYYEISEVALPKPSLYEFTALNSSVLKEYIDSKDYIFLDRISGEGIESTIDINLFFL